MLLVVSAFLAVVEWMSYRLLKRKCEGWRVWPRLKTTWISLLILVWLAFLINGFVWPTWRVTHPKLLSLLSILFFVVFIPKFLLAVSQLVDDVRYASQWVLQRAGSSVRPISRSSFISTLGMGVAGITFAGLLHGVTWGKYAYRVERVRLNIPNLPKAFDGLRLVQISDAHLGSFSNMPAPVLEALRSINDLKPDALLFTGDLVNTDAQEAEPWIEVFAALEAPMGKFSIMGNHDYADYGPFTEEEREASRKRLHEIHDEMGFRLLLNENIHWERDGSRIALVGVENWGKSFRRSGDLEKALKGSDADSLMTVLMSHDPTHWEEQVMGGKAPIELTLSGHTHGMQFGIEIPWLGIKWSPSKWTYTYWAGLYTEGKQHLYVNRGFGVLGFHGRVGMPPEITILELYSGDRSAHV